MIRSIYETLEVGGEHDFPGPRLRSEVTASVPTHKAVPVPVNVSHDKIR